MAQKSLVIAVSIFPPGIPGTAVRLAYDPDFPPQLMALEVAQAISKAMRKLHKRPKTHEPLPA
jgi:hypothetical protein